MSLIIINFGSPENVVLLKSSYPNNSGLVKIFALLMQDYLNFIR